jgi:hypothetical protein
VIVTPDKEMNVMSGFSQPPAVIAANGARSDYGYALLFVQLLFSFQIS